MKRRALLVLLASVMVLGVWLAPHLLVSPPNKRAGPSLFGHTHPVAGSLAHAKKKRLYTCGMHPNVVQEGPGSCPICGMDLTPMKNKAKASGKQAGIEVDPTMVQRMAVRVAHVKRGVLTRRVRALGEVVVAEDLVSVVNLKYSGWIERLYVDKTGARVRRGQPLFSIYSPELVAAQEEYLLALRSSGKDSPLARSALRRLALWDIHPALIRRISARGKAVRRLTIVAPRAGYVLHKTVVQGGRVVAGKDLFRIGKLDAIWVLARLYDFDAPWVAVDQAAAMELSFQRGKRYEGKVSYIYPTLDPMTRTLKVRLQFKNPSLRLKPGMFATVWIETQKKEDVVIVPSEAVLRSGKRNIVFVAKKLGHYEPRQVETGLEGEGHLVEVRKGLSAGELVVVSGQFLLDSESQLQEALQKLLAARLHARQPVTKGSATKKEGGWTCELHPRIEEPVAGSCPICGLNLVKKVGSPQEPPKRPSAWRCEMHPDVVESQSGSCPICGMKLQPQASKEAHR